MNRPQLLFPWILCALSTCALSACVGHDADRTLAARVDSLVAPRIAAHELSGAIVLTRAGKVVYSRGFGMAEHEANVPFTPDTPADGGSLAKPFTAAGVWWLVEEGRVELDAPVQRYVPEFPHAETTVRHLLTHSNGLPPYYEFFDPFFGKDEVRTTVALLAVVAKQSPMPSFTPGTRFEYSNLGFDAAALVIERVTGQRYDHFLRDRFFQRLGMYTTFARPARFADWSGVRTLGYRWTDNLWQRVDVFDMEAFLGASNLYFSAADLSRWASANAAGTALPPAVTTAGATPSDIDGRRSAINGLSWYCADDGARCYYTGSINAFHSLVYWDRARDESVVLVTNSSMPGRQVVTLQRDLVALLAGRSSGADDDAAFESFTDDTRAALAGVYIADDADTISVTGVAAQLSLRIGSGLEFAVFHIDPMNFYVPGPDLFLAFSGDMSERTMHARGMFRDQTLRRSRAH